MSHPQMLTPTEKLASGLTQLNIPDIIVLCGSTRFMTEMADIDRELTWAGHIVLKPGCDMKTPDPLWADPAKAEAGKQRLDELHRAKIRLAGGVLVVGDYIGDSTRREIAYARELGKPVTFMHPEVDPGEPDSDPAAAETCGTRGGYHGLSCDDLREELKERKATLGALVDHWRGLALDRAATIDRLRTEAAEVRAAALDDHERQFLTFALDLAADRVLSEDGFTDEDDAALASLRRMAAAARAYADALCAEPHPTHDHVCPDDARSGLLAALDAAGQPDCPGETNPPTCACPCQGCKHHCAAHQPDTSGEEPPQHLARGTNAEECPACRTADTPPPYPFICPGEPECAECGDTGACA